MPYWQTYKSRNNSPHPYTQLLNHDAAMHRVRGGPSRSYTQLMSAEAPLHLTRTDEATGCRWEPGELPHEGHDPEHCPYSIREEGGGMDRDGYGNGPGGGLSGEGEWENDGRDEWEKLVLRPTERAGGESEAEFEKPHPGTRRGGSLVNEAFEDRIIRHAQGKSVRVLGLEDDKLRPSHDAVTDRTPRGDNGVNSSEEPSTVLRSPFESHQDESRKNNAREESGLEKFMTKIKEGLKTPSPSSRPSTPSQHEEDEHGLIQAMTKMHEGLSSPAPSKRQHLSSSPEALSIAAEDEKRGRRKPTEASRSAHGFAHDDAEPKTSEKSMESLCEALASAPPPKHDARPGNHHDHKHPGEESGFGKVISKIKEGFEHTLMSRESAGIFDPRFWEKREELDHLSRTAKRDEEEMSRVKKEGEG